MMVWLWLLGFALIALGVALVVLAWVLDRRAAVSGTSEVSSYRPGPRPRAVGVCQTPRTSVEPAKRRSFGSSAND